jgi:hypothetical protein
MRRTPLPFAFAALVLIACNALVGGTEQCKTDSDCGRFGGGYICGGSGTCVAGNGGAPQGGGGGGGGATPPPAGDPGATPPPAQAGPLAVLYISPTNASVAPGKTQQFTVSAQDANGHAPSPAPTLTWSVSAGGGTIGDTGLYTAPAAAGGPYTVTVASGAISAKATVTVAVAAAATITIGEANILNNDDSGNADILLAQVATLAQDATLKSLSFYVAMADGNLRLGVYDDTGPNNGPGALKAETAEFPAAMGWNAVPVVTPVLLKKGNYWLAYAPQSSNLHFNLSDNGQGNLAYFNQPYGPLPPTFSTTPTTDTRHWSFYATLQP